MGFLHGLGKMLKGEPLFEDPKDQQKSTRSTLQDEEFNPFRSERTPVDDSGYKVVPKIKLEHVSSRRDGDRLEVTAWVTNESDSEIELDKMTMCNKKIEIDRRLQPNEAHEIKLYSDTIPKHDDNHKANLDYRLIRSDDYFCQDYRIEYHFESDGTYIINELHPESTVRDI